MDDCPYIEIPSISIHPDRINVYRELHWINDKRKKNAIATLIKQSKSHNNKVSSQAARKINKAITYLLFLANDKKCYSRKSGKEFKFKATFVTLTLSGKQMHTDNEIKNSLLNQFLVEAKKKWKVSNYIWRAEKQENGNIHFHLLTDKFIPHVELKDTWNRIQEKLGYVSAYRASMKEFFKNGFRIRERLLKHWSEANQRKAYQKGCSTDWASPNSTDIHSLRLISNVTSYLQKYFNKETQTGQSQGRLWGCSTSLSNVSGARTELDRATDSELRQLKELYQPRIITGDYYSIIFLNIHQLIKSGLPIIAGLVTKYLFELFNYSYQSFIN